MIDIRFSDSIADTGAVSFIFDAEVDEATLRPLPDAARRLVAQAARAQRFAGKAGQVAETFVDIDGIARRTLVVGCAGKPYEQAGAAVSARLLASGETDVSIVAPGASAGTAADIALGAALRAWRHDAHRTELKPDKRVSLARAILVVDGGEAAVAWEERRALVEGVHFTRTLVAEPGNIVHPESFVERCRAMEALGVEIEVLGEPEMRAMGMGALLGVAQGSARPPRLLAMRWRGAEGDPVALVGKGVTFDSGGLSIKPAAGMDAMKWDMGGAGAVAGAMMALAGRKAKAHVVGVCGLVENMPDGNAQRPGDVVTTMSGRTVEVLDTDCEGRLVLCDVLTWVQRTYRPHAIVDLATLTGTMILALGHEQAGLFANDDALADQLLAAGKASGDALWRMPLGDAYDTQIDSDIADVKNMGPRAGSAITAAHFLKRFVDDGVAWAHLDIAGTAWANEDRALCGKGASGFGVRLLDWWIAGQEE